jgi:UDP-2,3-diacylglucosamine pyrophosphatase LpxH
MINVDTLIVSDIHLGLRTARVAELTKLIAETGFSRLILLGDVLHSMNLRKLRFEDYEFLARIREIHESGKEVVWITGNHDRELSHLSPFLGIPVIHEYEWEYRGEKHLAFHGDEFETPFTPFQIVNEAIFFFYYGLTPLIIIADKLITFTQKKFGLWRKFSHHVAVNAIAKARARGSTRVFCGHTHFPYKLTENGVSYWNTGVWIHQPSSCVMVGESGVETMLVP